MDLARFQSAVSDHLVGRARELGLDAERLQVEYVLNWGGFVNRSFRVTDGGVLHLKLACEPEIRHALWRLWDLREMMSERYHAPAAVAWVAVPGTEYAGVLSRWIDGSPPGVLDERLAREVVRTIGKLHRDRELAERLPAPAAPATCADVYRRTYHARFMEDLEYVEAERPPFVLPEVLAWMRGEADALMRSVDAAPAFAHAADAPTHGDLWLDNLLVTPDGAWYLLDWDDLALGDPALDWCMLFGPARGDCRTAVERALPPDVAADPAVAERLALYARTSLLDWTIDPLADWIAATEAPGHAEEVRAEKERIHTTAREAYLLRFAGPPG